VTTGGLWVDQEVPVASVSRVPWPNKAVELTLGVAKHGVTALGEPSQVGGIPHPCKGSRVCAIRGEGNE
jgi:hypothetical protein